MQHRNYLPVLRRKHGHRPGSTADERRREAETRYALPFDASPILGNVGSFEHRKGQVVLLEAVAEIRRTLPKVHLILVGDGPDEELLKAKVGELELEANVTFFPFTREPVHVFEIIDVLVLSSLYKEGLPNVLLEAMSMRLPVVASRMAGIPEVVIGGRTGWMTEPGDVHGLARAVERLWEDPTICREMGNEGRRLMEENFNKVHQFDTFLDHFVDTHPPIMMGSTTDKRAGRSLSQPPGVAGFSVGRHGGAV